MNIELCVLEVTLRGNIPKMDEVTQFQSMVTLLALLGAPYFFFLDLSNDTIYIYLNFRF